MAQQGPVATYKKAVTKLDSYTPLGYSLCGVVVEVGAGAEEFAVGDLVAAAGNEFALHAEVNWVPVNLCVPVPEGVAPQHAAFATVGAIAMQGVRRGEPQLGEMACVIGLGLVGQLVVRLLVAAGVHVVGIDTIDERCRLAEAAGAMSCASPDDEGAAYLEQVIRTATGGLGADHVFLAAGGHTNGPSSSPPASLGTGPASSTSARRALTCRGTPTTRRSSTSASRAPTGPDATTTATSSRASTTPPGTCAGPSGATSDAFSTSSRRAPSTSPRSSRARGPSSTRRRCTTSCAPGRCAGWASCSSTPGPSLRTTVTGPGGPAPRRHDRCRPPRAGPPGRRRPRCGSVSSAPAATRPRCCCRTSRSTPGSRSARWPRPRRCRPSTPSARSASSRTTTNAEEVLADPAIDAVFVVTRHHSHAGFICRALEHGKSVFVEKPLALTRAEVDGILDVVERTGNDRIMVGFNRRFAPLLVGMRERFGTAGTPVSAGTWSTPAGWRPAAGTSTSSSRGRGSSVRAATSSTRSAGGSGTTPSRSVPSAPPTGPTCTRRSASPTGLWATVTYSTGGDPRVPKETLDVSGGGRNARLDNFARATVWTRGGRDTKRSFTGQDKGQRPELDAFLEAVRLGAAMPIGLDALVATTRATIAVGESLASWQAGGPVSRSVQWYARRLRRMTPEEVIARVGDQLRQVRWAERQVRPGDAWALVGTLLPRRAIASPVARAARAHIAPEAARRVVAAADRLLAGDWEVLGTPRPDVVDPDWFRDPVTGTRAPDTALAFRVDHRDETVTGNVKSVWELSRHHHLTVLAAAWWLTQDVRYADVVAAQLRSWWASEPVPVRHPLDERDRDRRAADELGVDPAAARRLAGGRRPLRGQPPGARAAPLAPGVPGGVPQPRVVREQPRHRRSGRQARGGLRPPVVRGERGLAPRRRPVTWSASSPPTPSPAASTASSPPTTTASSPSSASSPSWRRRPRGTRSPTPPGRCSPAPSTPLPRCSTPRAAPRVRVTATRAEPSCSTTPTTTPGRSCWAVARAPSGACEWWPPVTPGVMSTLLGALAPTPAVGDRPQVAPAGVRGCRPAPAADVAR